jgi:hypothetical protein
VSRKRVSIRWSGLGSGRAVLCALACVWVNWPAGFGLNRGSAGGTYATVSVLAVQALALAAAIGVRSFASFSFTGKLRTGARKNRS